MPARTDVTLKDIAEAVGKSVAAVSRALNNHDDISPKTRAYIKQVAQEMGYTPNLMAQRLQKQATDTVGIILPVFSARNIDPFFSELLVGIANEATEQGFDLLVSTCVPGPDEEQVYNRLVSSRRVDGLIVARPRWQDERIKFLKEKQFPFIIVGAVEPEVDVPYVTDDIASGIQLAVSHLITQGHQKIALVNLPDNLVAASQYLIGFQEAMLNAGLTINETWLESCRLSQKEGYQAGQRLLSKSSPPTAIATADDVVALGVMTAIQNQGFEIGHDIAVTGYGDIPLVEYSQPPLTTVQRPTYTLGQYACRTLIGEINSSNVTEAQISFKPSLVIRQSSDMTLWL